jgi:hypothetical protein
MTDTGDQLTNRSVELKRGEGVGGHVTLMGEVRKCTRFWCGRQKETGHSEDRSVDGRMGSERILGRLAGGVEWIQLAHDTDRWQAVVNTVMKLRVLATWS